MMAVSQGNPIASKILGGGTDATSTLAEEELLNAITAKERNGSGTQTWASRPTQDQEEPDGDDAHQQQHSHKGVEPDRLKHIQRIEALEYSSDVFGSSVALRTDTIGMFKTMASSLAVILAFKHTSKLTKANQIGPFVAAVLVFFVYIISQLTYYITHWLKWTNMQKRNIARTYNNSGAERSEQEEQRDAAATLWGIRVSAGEMLANFTRDVIVLANTYIAFILVAILLDQINANFADGQFIFEKLIELVVIVLIVFAFFACISYRREVLLKSYRL
jgi:hypothetical protein